MNFLEVINKMAVYLLPIVGLLLLIALMVLVIRVIKVVKNVDIVVEKSKKTVDQINDSLEEIQKPIATVAKVTEGIDMVYGFSEKVVREIAVKIVEALNYCKKIVYSGNDIKEIKEDNDGKRD